MKLHLNSIVIILFQLILTGTIFGEARYRVAPVYEDTIRIVLIWNDAHGLSSCDTSTTPVGEKTMEFVRAALNPEKIPNIRALKNSTSAKVSWEDVEALWGEDTVPHVIVHINAGWSSGWNGEELDEIFQNAINLKMGIVSIGDDAANLASNTFGFRNVDNAPAPLGDAQSIDSLWIGLLRANDEMIKVRAANNGLMYPGLNGIISNAVDSILKDTIMQFFPFGAGRCQADADKYNTLYPSWITMLGYQQGYMDKKAQPGPNELNVLVAIQDTTEKDIIRRAVALSFQPSFLQNKAAAEQIIYDAIMFGSLTHTLSVANRLSIRPSSNEAQAGKDLTLYAEIFDTKGNPMTELQHFVQWEILKTDQDDKITTSIGDSTVYSATKAWRTVTFRAWVTDFETGALLQDTLTIPVTPGAPHHLDIQKTTAVTESMLHKNTDPVTVHLSLNTLSDTLYAVVRDTFNNFIRFSDSTVTFWQSNKPEITAVTGTPSMKFTGVVTMIRAGNTYIEVFENYLIADTAFIQTDAVVVRSALTRDTDGDGFLDRVELRLDTPVKINTSNSSGHNITVSFASNQFTIKSISTNSPVDSVINIDLHENELWGFQTDWILDLGGDLVITTSDNSVDSIKLSGIVAIDGAGPVIKKAVLHPGLERAADTLKITMSELVNRNQLLSIEPGKAFRYYLDSAQNKPEPKVFNGAYIVISEPDTFIENLLILIPHTTEGAIELTPLSDRIQFVYGSSDITNNAPPPEEIAHKAIVEAGGNNFISVVVYPNPLIPGSVKNWPQTLQMRYRDAIKNQSEGVLIIIKTKRPLAPDENGNYGSVVVYDALGHHIINLQLMKTSNNLEYVVFWNGRNNKVRFVGRGVYLAVIKMQDAEGVHFKKSVKIGVKR